VAIGIFSKNSNVYQKESEANHDRHRKPPRFTILNIENKEPSNHKFHTNQQAGNDRTVYEIKNIKTININFKLVNRV